MQGPFPALIHLKLVYNGVLPDGFLGGSAPHLQSLELHYVSFPALLTFLLSATDLVDLALWDIPNSESGYIFPKMLVTCLAVLANLKSLAIEYDDSRPIPPLDRDLLPPTRTVHPALIHFKYFWVFEYLEELVARIDAPLLDSIYITSYQQVIFDIPQFDRFMRRTTLFQNLNEAHVDFEYTVFISILFHRHRTLIKSLSLGSEFHVKSKIGKFHL